MELINIIEQKLSHEIEIAHRDEEIKKLKQQVMDLNQELKVINYHYSVLADYVRKHT